MREGFTKSATNSLGKWIPCSLGNCFWMRAREYHFSSVASRPLRIPFSDRAGWAHIASIFHQQSPHMCVLLSKQYIWNNSVRKRRVMSSAQQDQDMNSHSHSACSWTYTATSVLGGREAFLNVSGVARFDFPLRKERGCNLIAAKRNGCVGPEVVYS